MFSIRSKFNIPVLLIVFSVTGLTVNCAGGGDTQSEASATEQVSVTAPSISVAEAQEKYKDSGVTFIDVRSDMERSVMEIPGSMHISIHGNDFEDEIAQLDTTQTYVVYCHSGPRSQRAANHMMSSGFSNVYNMNGGISSWDGPTN